VGLKGGVGSGGELGVKGGVGSREWGMVGGYGSWMVGEGGDEYGVFD
jgi:hypothetical protein